MHKTAIAILDLMYAGFGSILLFQLTFLTHAEIHLSHPTALMEVRAFYGGMELGLGAYFLLALTRPELHRQVLLLGLFLLIPTLFGRIFGGVIDGISGDYLWIALAVKIPIAILTLLTFRKA